MAGIRRNTQVRGKPGDPLIAADRRGIEFYVVNPTLAIPEFFWWGQYVCCTKETWVQVADTVFREVVPLPVRVAEKLQEHVLLFIRNVVGAPGS